MRRRSGNSDIAKSISGVIIAIVCLSALGYFFYYQLANTVDMKDDGCPKNSDNIPEKIVLMIDVTNPFSGNQRLALENISQSITTKSKKFTEIKIYKMSENILGKNDFLASVCNPGDPKDVDKLVQSAKEVREKFEKEFKGKINDVLSQLGQSSGANFSPIMESIQAIAQLEFSGVSKPKKLYIISDFVQHYGDFSFYQDIPDFDQFKDSGRMATKGAELFNTDVLMMKMANEYQIQKKERFMQFWKSYFLDNGSVLFGNNGYCDFGVDCDRIL